MDDMQAEQLKLTNDLLKDMVANQRENMHRLIKVFIITVVCFTLILISMVTGFFVYESQFETIETITTEKTVTQEVSGNDSTINNVEGNQYNDDAIHNDNK